MRNCSTAGNAEITGEPQRVQRSRQREARRSAPGSDASRSFAGSVTVGCSTSNFITSWLQRDRSIVNFADARVYTYPGPCTGPVYVCAGIRRRGTLAPIHGRMHLHTKTSSVSRPDKSRDYTTSLPPPPAPSYYLRPPRRM